MQGFVWILIVTLIIIIGFGIYLAIAYKNKTGIFSPTKNITIPANAFLPLGIVRQLSPAEIKARNDAYSKP